MSTIQPPNEHGNQRVGTTIHRWRLERELSAARANVPADTVPAAVANLDRLGHSLLDCIDAIHQHQPEAEMAKSIYMDVEITCHNAIQHVFRELQTWRYQPSSVERTLSGQYRCRYCGRFLDGNYCRHCNGGAW